MQYRKGLAAVTNGSTTVTGDITLWTFNAQAGDRFFLQGDADEVLYQIASVESDTELTLTAAYQGETGSAVPYVISRDRTPNTEFNLVHRGDTGSAALFSENFARLDTIVPNIEAATEDFEDALGDAVEAADTATAAAVAAAASAGDASSSASAAATSASDASDSADAAAGSASAASTSASAAADSASAGATSETNAATWASAASDSADAAATSASAASTSAAAASTSASDAAGSADAAATSETNAEASAGAAATSEANAATSASDASDSADAAASSASSAAQSVEDINETIEDGIAAGVASITAAVEAARDAAEDSATAAAGSASDASDSAGAAATSETNAAASAGAAATSASSASTSASSAATSASDAADSADAAATSETNASTSATSAAGSASSASISAGDAADSADEAATSETNAATSASTATTQAGNASTSASAAAGSASAASTSAGNAATSASAAATSASNAATSESNAASAVSTAIAALAPIASSGSASHLSTGTVPSGRLTGTYSISISGSSPYWVPQTGVWHLDSGGANRFHFDSWSSYYQGERHTFRNTAGSDVLKIDPAGNVEANNLALAGGVNAHGWLQSAGWPGTYHSGLAGQFGVSGGKVYVHAYNGATASSGPMVVYASSIDLYADSGYITAYNGKRTFDVSDSYLRLNQAGHYANGVYSPGNISSGASFYSHAVSGGGGTRYGSLNVSGSLNGWAGINFSSGNTDLMWNTDMQGAHKAGVGWLWSFTNGSMDSGTVPRARLSGVGNAVDYNVSVTGSAANTLVLRDGYGYSELYYTRFTNSDSENPGIGQFLTQNTSDNYMRKSSTGHVINTMRGTAGYLDYFWSNSHPSNYYLVNNWTGAHWQITSNHGSPVRVGYADNGIASSGTGYVVFGDGFRMCWGSVSATANAAVTVYFPSAFTTSNVSVTCSGGEVDSGRQENGPGVLSSSITTSYFQIYNAINTAIATRWIAVGY